MPSDISWTDETWNFIFGCTKISAGCLHCYAERLSTRFGWTKRPWTAENADQIVVREEMLLKPTRWSTPKRIFVNSMSDWAHDNVTEQTCDRMFAVMLLAPHHQYQLLTKRAENMRNYLNFHSRHKLILAEAKDIYDSIPRKPNWMVRPESIEWPMRNVWIGVSAENQKEANRRIPILSDTVAAVRFVSFEPLLGPIDAWSLMCPRCSACGAYLDIDDGAWRSTGYGWEHKCPYIHPQAGHMPAVSQVDWVIVGGESGPGSRYMDQAWAADLYETAKWCNVPYFFKQQSGPKPETNPWLEMGGKRLVIHQYPGQVTRPVEYEEKEVA